MLVLLTIAARMLQQRDVRRAKLAGVQEPEIEGEEVDAGSQEGEKRVCQEEKGKVAEV